MARSFDGLNDRLESTTVPISAAPILMCMWVYPSTDSASQAFANIGTGGVNNNRFSLWTDGSGLVSAQCRTSLTSSAVSSSAVTVSAWNHIAAYFESNVSRYAYLNGVAGSQNTDTRTPSGMDRLRLGESMTAGTDVNGIMAEFAIYSPASKTLADDICATLADGYSPLCVCPDGLVAYYPLWGRYDPETDLVGGNDLTVTTAVYADHPRIIYPSRNRRIYIPAAAPATGNRRRRLLIAGIR